MSSLNPLGSSQGLEGDPSLLHDLDDFPLDLGLDPASGEAMQIDTQDEYAKWLDADIKDEPFSSEVSSSAQFPLSDNEDPPLFALPSTLNSVPLPSIYSSKPQVFASMGSRPTQASNNPSPSPDSTSAEKRAKKRGRKDKPQDEMEISSSAGNILKPLKVVFGDDKLLDIFSNFRTKSTADVSVFFETIRAFLTKLNESILFLFQNFRSAQEAIQAFLGQTSSLISHCDGLFESTHLSPNDFSALLDLQKFLRLYHEQLSLLVIFSPTIARLIILREPFPYVYTKKNKVNDNGYQLVLLRNPAFEISEVGEIEAQTIGVQLFRSGKGSVSTADRHFLDQYGFKFPESLDSSILGHAFLSNLSSTAFFSDFFCPSLLEGTNKLAATLKFSCPIKVRSGNRYETLVFETAETKGVVVITNENQYGDALSRLFHHSLFGSVNSLSLPYYMNWLQLYLLISTKQSFQTPTRFLTQSEINYLSLRMKIENSQVPKAESEAFWEYFAPILRSLRYQKQWIELFSSRLIFGFLNRENSQRLLLRMPKGHFLLRFSDTNPGLLTISYRTSEEEDKNIKHYLVKDDDLAKKSITDFLKSRTELQYILQYIQGSDLAPENSDSDVDLGLRLYEEGVWVMKEARIFSKDSVLSRFYKKKVAGVNDEDYDDF